MGQARSGREQFFRAIAVLLFVLATGPVVQAQRPRACEDADKRFDQLVDLYLNAAAAAMGDGTPDATLERARKAAIAGDRQATIVVTGISLMLRASQDRFDLSVFRQVCGFADKTEHPLHILTCAYFNALNTRGNRELKFALVEKLLARFTALPANTPGLDAALSGHGAAFAACIRALPKPHPV